MSLNHLAQQIIWWQEEDAQSLSIKKKSKESFGFHKSTQNRYFLLPDNQDAYFTYREMEIAMYLFEPMTYKTIGEKMGLSDRTVECHVRRMRIKLSSRDRFDLIDKIADLKIIQDFRAAFQAGEAVL